MKLLPHPPPGWKRKTLPDVVKMTVLCLAIAAEAARADRRPISILGLTTKEAIREMLAWLGIVPERARYDHRPPLSERKFDRRKNDTVPSQHDPFWIEVLDKSQHDARTFGRGGEKRITSYGSDAHIRAKELRILKQKKAKRRIRGGGFHKTLSRKFSGKVGLKQSTTRRNRNGRRGKGSPAS